MKTLCLLCICFTLHKVVQHVHADTYMEMYVSLLDTVVINCRVEFNSGSDVYRWKRGDTLISRGPYRMPEFQNDKFQITVDHNNKAYTLKIFNVTKEDLEQQYECQTQILNTMNQIYYTLKLTEYKSTALKEIMSTQDNLATGNPFFVMNTDSHSHINIKNETLNETGLSLRKTIYYSLPAVGLVLVACLSILCYARIHQKCRTVQKNNAPNAQVYHPEQPGVVERLEYGIEDYSSHYATINEGEMLSTDELASVADTTNKPKQSCSVSDKLYIEIPEDEVKRNISEKTSNELSNLNKTGTPAILKNTPSSETKPDSYSDNGFCPQFDNRSDSDESSKDGGDITCSNADDYLHPYTTLNVNDMEYLNSYSTVINVDQVASVVTDSSFFLKKDIVLDESTISVLKLQK